MKGRFMHMILEFGFTHTSHTKKINTTYFENVGIERTFYSKTRFYRCPVSNIKGDQSVSGQ